MDVNKDVRESYQHLIKALPTDLLTRFVLSDSLLIIAILLLFYENDYYFIVFINLAFRKY